MPLLYAVNGSVNPGFRVTRCSLGYGVGLGVNPTTRDSHILRLDDSLSRLLGNEEDADVKFTLRFAKLVVCEDEITRLGAQTLEEAKADRSVLVLVDLCTDTDLGVTKIGPNHRIPQAPHELARNDSRGASCVLYEFQVGDSLYVSHPPNAYDDTGSPLIFTLTLRDDLVLEQDVRTKAVRRQRRQLCSESLLQAQL